MCKEYHIRIFIIAENQSKQKVRHLASEKLKTAALGFSFIEKGEKGVGFTLAMCLPGTWETDNETRNLNSLYLLRKLSLLLISFLPLDTVWLFFSLIFCSFIYAAQNLMCFLYLKKYLIFVKNQLLCLW